MPDPAAIDAAMKAMNAMPIEEGKDNIVGYALSGDQVTDANIRQALIALGGAKKMSVTNGRVTNAAFNALAGLKDLQELDLTAVKMTEVDLQALSALPILEKLRLNSTGLTDAGLKELAEFKRLKELKVEKEQVSDAAVEELRKALPECKLEVSK
jgi:hypothetical protein